MHVRSLSGIATDEKTDDLVLIKKNDDDQLMINMTQSKDNISTHQNNLHFSTGYCAQWTYLASPARSPFHHSAKNDFVVFHRIVDRRHRRLIRRRPRRHRLGNRNRVRLFFYGDTKNREG